MHFSTLVLSGLLSAGLLNAAPVADKRADSSFTGLPSFTFTKPTGLPSFTFTKPTGLPSFTFTKPTGLPSFTFTESFTKPTGSFSVPPLPSSVAKRADSSFSFSVPPVPTGSFTFTKPTGLPSFTFTETFSSYSHHSFTGTFSKPTGTFSFTHPVPTSSAA